MPFSMPATLQRLIPIAFGSFVLSDSLMAAALNGKLLVQSQDPGSVNYRIVEYDADGNPLQTISPVVAPDSTDQWRPRDLVVSGQTVHLFNGTFDPYLSTLDAKTGAWDHRTHPGWSTVNNTTYGGIARIGDRVFVTNMATSGRPSRGVVMFDLAANTSVDFAGILQPVDLTAGLDGNLWVLFHNVAYAYDPQTLDLLDSVTFPDSDPRGIAVDADGYIYVASWTGRLGKFAPDGNLSGNIFLSGNLVDIDISPDNRLAVCTRIDGAWLTTVNFNFRTHLESGRWNSFAAFIPAKGGLPGDMNCDGVISVSDIGGFVLALTDPAGYAAQYPGCDINLADVNGDNAISVSDIGSFVALLTT